MLLSYWLQVRKCHSYHSAIVIVSCCCWISKVHFLKKKMFHSVARNRYVRSHVSEFTSVPRIHNHSHVFPSHNHRPWLQPFCSLHTLKISERLARVMTTFPGSRSKHPTKFSPAIFNQQLQCKKATSDHFHGVCLARFSLWFQSYPSI